MGMQSRHTPTAAAAVALLAGLLAAGLSAMAVADADARSQYQSTLDQADQLMAAGNAFEAVRKYESAGRIAYNNKLQVDQAALASHLAAARAARDAGAAAPSPVAPAVAAKVAPPAPMAATPGASANQGAALQAGGADDPGAWLAYADALVAATDYGEAVRAYERTARMARQSRAAIDLAALEARRAQAMRLRDAPAARPVDIAPEPPPPLPTEPGTRAIAWLHDRPGRITPWKLHYEGFVVADTRASQADLKAFDANLHKVTEVLARAPVLSPPMGFDFDVDAALGETTFDVQGLRGVAAARLPLQSEIRFSGSALLARGSATARVEEAMCRTGVKVNALPQFSSPAFRPDEKVDEAYYAEPVHDGDLGGVPVYGDTLVVSRPGIPLWIPVTYAQAFDALLPRYKAAADSSRQAMEGRQRKYREFTSEAARAGRQREVAAERSAGREEMARKLELMQHRWEEDARKESEQAGTDPKLREAIDLQDRANALAAGMDAAGRATQACLLVRPRADASSWELVARATPGCSPLVRTNPRLLDLQRPRPGLQVIFLPRVSLPGSWFAAPEGRTLRNKPGDCVALARLVRQVDWSALRSLLAD